jgi:ribosomal peptide maturation radical SAM protein 1
MDVTLVSMPFGNVLTPSIGLSLLKAGLESRDVSSGIEYFTFAFAKLAGSSFYLSIADDREPSIHELGGEWVFARALFDTEVDRDEDYVQTILRERTGWNTQSGVNPVPEAQIRRMLRARNFVEGFLDRCLERIAELDPKIVGFTSIFQQHVASLALAKRIKENLPHTFIVIGGANAEGVMGAETLRQFAFVDAAVSGEGDVVFPELVERVLEGKPLVELQGVRTRDSVTSELEDGRFSQAPSVGEMDELPYPDYSDFFEQFRRSGLGRTWQPRIYFETSRGCWWGAKQHCTFCGLNGASMGYRSKSPSRAIDELVYLSDTYDSKDVHVVDNILDMGYFNTVLPELARRRLGIELFYETKANLKKEHLKLMRDAGILEIQPGIESFSDAVLGLMRKGVTALQNIQLLKWCRELGLTPYWNVLWGFPGEPEEDYVEMARIVPYLTHLQPPGGIAGIRLDRFSPNFFDAGNMGFVDVSPLPAYRYVYPLEDEALMNLAYHFTFRYADGRDVNRYVHPLLDELRLWMSASDAALFMVDAGESLAIWDLRSSSVSPLTVLSGIERAVYLECDAIRDLNAITSSVNRHGGASTTAELAPHLQTLVARGLMLERNGRYLSLAVRLGDYIPSRSVVNRFFSTAKTLGEPAEGGLRVPLERLNGSDGHRVVAERFPTEGGRRFSRSRSRTLSTSQFSMDGRDSLFVEFRVRVNRKDSSNGEKAGEEEDREEKSHQEESHQEESCKEETYQESR